MPRGIKLRSKGHLANLYCAVTMAFGLSCGGGGGGESSQLEDPQKLPDIGSPLEEYQVLGKKLGGVASSNTPGKEAFDQTFLSLNDTDRGIFEAADNQFNRNWVAASTVGIDNKKDGLGPVFNQKSCVGCHVDDGRGRPPRT